MSFAFRHHGARGVATFRGLTGLVSVTAFIAVACNHSPTVPDTEHGASLSPDAQWAGGELHITLTGLDPEEIDAVLAGSDSLSFESEGSSVVSARLPTDVDGTREIWLETSAGRIRVGLVDIHGFEGSETMMPRLVGGLRDWPGGPGGAAVIAPMDTALAILHLTSRSANVFEGIHAGPWLYSPGQSSDPLDVYARAKGQESITQWHLTTAVPPTPLDTIPLTASWSIARGAPDIWFAAYHHFLRALRGPASDGSFETLLETQAEGTLDWEFLPQLGLVAPAGSIYREGLPVFDMSSGEIAYRVKDVFQSDALVALPATGDFAVAGHSGTADALTVFDGRTGEIEAQVPIESDAANLEFDSGRGVFFVLHAYPWQDGFIGVHDAQNLELIGRMVVPGLDFWDAELAPGTDELFVVFTESHLIGEDATGTVVYRYRLP